MRTLCNGDAGATGTDLVAFGVATDARAPFVEGALFGGPTVETARAASGIDEVRRVLVVDGAAAADPTFSGRGAETAALGVARNPGCNAPAWGPRDVRPGAATPAAPPIRAVGATRPCFAPSAFACATRCPRFCSARARVLVVRFAGSLLERFATRFATRAARAVFAVRFAGRVVARFRLRDALIAVSDRAAGRFAVRFAGRAATRLVESVFTER